ncbi:helix-turn-helix domain-containing protein [Amycolatopsis anabasis]|uniref:helix-turn-helix domain-containing protein n=1 Tax=Amycolatopsis anabasis TaxID=1840409 RepID=UPI00131ED0F3|nr:helix-turn-helix transcriptional regulator [Amycolatopsis anabasis]
MGIHDDATVRARELGNALREIREAADLTLRGLAAILHWSPSKLSMLETGKRCASEVDVAMILASCGVFGGDLKRLMALARQTDDSYRLRPHNQWLPAELRSLIVHESTATSITSFDPLVLPGLLQTEAYARAIFHWIGLLPEEDLNLRVEARLARQSLLRRPNPPECTFFIHENALRTMIGGPEIMDEQILHLLALSSKPHCAIRVVPRSAGPFGALGGSFRVMRYADAPPVVYADTLAAGVFFEERWDVTAYNGLMGRVGKGGLDGGQSREWLATLANHYHRARSQPDDPRAP